MQLFTNKNQTRFFSHDQRVSGLQRIDVNSVSDVLRLSIAKISTLLQYATLEVDEFGELHDGNSVDFINGFQFDFMENQEFIDIVEDAILSFRAFDGKKRLVRELQCFIDHATETSDGITTLTFNAPADNDFVITVDSNKRKVIVNSVSSINCGYILGELTELYCDKKRMRFFATDEHVKNLDKVKVGSVNDVMEMYEICSYAVLIEQSYLMPDSLGELIEIAYPKNSEDVPEQPFKFKFLEDLTHAQIMTEVFDIYDFDGQSYLINELQKTISFTVIADNNDIVSTRHDFTDGSKLKVTIDHFNETLTTEIIGSAANEESADNDHDDAEEIDDHEDHDTDKTIGVVAKHSLPIKLQIANVVASLQGRDQHTSVATGNHQGED